MKPIHIAILTIVVGIAGIGVGFLYSNIDGAEDTIPSTQTITSENTKTITTTETSTQTTTVTNTVQTVTSTTTLNQTTTVTSTVTKTMKERASGTAGFTYEEEFEIGRVDTERINFTLKISLIGQVDLNWNINKTTVSQGDTISVETFGLGEVDIWLKIEDIKIIVLDRIIEEPLMELKVDTVAVPIEEMERIVSIVIKGVTFNIHLKIRGDLNHLVEVDGIISSKSQMANSLVDTHYIQILEQGNGEIKYNQRLNIILTTTVDVEGQMETELGTQTYPQYPREPEINLVVLNKI